VHCAYLREHSLLARNLQPVAYPEELARVRTCGDVANDVARPEAAAGKSHGILKEGSLKKACDFPTCFLVLEHGNGSDY